MNRRHLLLTLCLAAGTVMAQPPNDPRNIQVQPPQNGPGGSRSTGNATFNQAVLKGFVGGKPANNAQGGQGAQGTPSDGVPNGGNGSVGSVATQPAATASVLNEHTARFAATITASDLHAHLSFLASDELEGRETAQHGQKIAARYLAAQFAKMGLQPGNKGSWYQTFELEQLTLNDVKIALGEKTILSKGTDFIFFNKFAVAQAKQFPLAFAGFGITDQRYDNLDGLDLKGKAAVVLGGEPQREGKNVLSGTAEPSAWGSDVKTKQEALKKAGAAMMVLVVPDDKFNANAANPWVKHRMEGSALRLAYKQKEDGMPWIMVPERVFAAYVKKSGYTFASLRTTLDGKDDVPEIRFNKTQIAIQPDAVLEKTVSENVLGFLPGTDKKDEVIVITAHYDHLGIKEGQIHYGADDDGSGTAAILEIAEAFAEAARNGHAPSRSILFMPVSGEEKGLLGSEYYADHPVYPLRNTVCNLNIDMIGRLDADHEADSNYVYIIGSDMLSTDLHKANELANQAVTKIKLDYRYNKVDDPNQFYYRSDHYNFAKNDIPVIFYFTGVHADYHKPTDTIEKIMFGKAAIITRLVFSTAWQVANQQERLVVDKKTPKK